MKIVLLIAGILLILVAAEALMTFWPFFSTKRGMTKERADGLTVVAHRGGAALGPENSLDCIEKGIRAGADMIEIDIHLTADGELVVCHDQSIDRTTNGKGLIREMTLAQLKEYNIVHNGKVTSQKIPTLREVIDLVDHRAKLLIEIKRTGDIYQGIEQKLVNMIDATGIGDEVVVQSFNDSVLENLHAIKPELPLEKLLFAKLAFLPVIFDVSLNPVDMDKYDYIQSFNYFYGGVSRKQVERLKAAGKGVKIWTLKGPEDAVDLPVDAVITNNPDLWK